MKNNSKRTPDSYAELKIRHLNWAAFCDKIYCIHCANYTDRMQGLESEFRRVGIWDSGILEIKVNYKNPVDDFLKSMTGVNPCSLCMPLFIESYRILAEAKYKKLNRIAIIEDDVRFLKDQNKISSILDAMPEDYNCYQFSKISCKSPKVAENWERCKNDCINDFFVRGDGREIWSGAFYILSSEGISQLLEIMSHNARNPDGLFHLMSKVAISKDDVVIQKPLKNSVRGDKWSLASMSPDKDIFGTRIADFES